MSYPMNDRETRKGQNESWFRVVCECADEECTQRIAISVAEYELVRSDPRRFVVAAGHADESIERVVAGRGSYEIVEKRGDAGLVAQMEAPRPEG